MNRGIIFDFDGVICDSVNVKTEAFASMYEQYGSKIVAQVVQYHLEHGGISRYEKFRHYHKVFLGITLSEEEILQMGEQFSLLALQKVIESPYLPGVVKFIERSFDQAYLYICTGTPEAEINIILRKRNLDKYFKAVYGTPKSKTEIINTIITAFNHLPQQLEFYGDAMTDYLAAQDTSVKFIGVYSSATVFPEGTEVIQDFMMR